MSLALVFSGQGTQHPQMLPWLDRQPEAAATLEQLAGIVGDDWRARLADPTRLGANQVAQPLLTGLAMAAWQCLAGRVPNPGIVAGYSVGELAAFAVAGVFGPATALALACRRAALMDASVNGLRTGLLAVQGPGAQCRAEAFPGLAPAILIAESRVVVGGRVETLDDATTEWSRAGLRCTRLAVQVASHTPWMSAAATAFARDLADVPFKTPRATVVCNASGNGTRDPRVLAEALAAQITLPVRWGECMDTLAERRVRCVLEVGPGTSLASMWRERHPDIAVRSIDEFRDPDGVAEWVQHSLG